MPESKAPGPRPKLWPCPACDQGWMYPAPGEKVALGPFRTVCDFCDFEMKQSLDAKHHKEYWTARRTQRP